MTRTQLITLVAAQFMIEHNARRPLDSGPELLERALDAAEELVIAAETKYQGPALEAGPSPRDELLTRLRSLLETFGEHLPDCERPDEAKDEGCTCGFRLNLMAVRDLVPYSLEVRGESLPPQEPKSLP